LAKNWKPLSDALERLALGHDFVPAWDNPPHKSHLCHRCGNVFRTADVPTNGVAFPTTRGDRDSWNLPPAIPPDHNS